MRFLLAAIVICASVDVPTPAHASDFWDEVRTPGLRVWREDLARARLALRARRFVQAREAATLAIQTLPQRAEGYVVRARVSAEQGVVEGAREDLLAALERDESALDSPEDGTPAAEVLARAGDYTTAARVLQRVLGRMRSGGSRRMLYGLYGDVLMALGSERLVDAVRAYREALRAARHDPRSSLGLALALRRTPGADRDAPEWRDLARRVAARGRVEALLASLPIPEEERLARRAITLEAMDDNAGAVESWGSIAAGVWQSHAAEQAEALSSTRRRRRP